jgi:hypothetical protein
MKFALVSMVVLIGLVAGCAEEADTGGSAATTTTEASGGEGEAVAVSEACRAAFAKYAKALKRSNQEMEDGFDPSDYNPDEGPFQVATLKGCKSGAEWLAGVAPHSEGAACIACVAPEEVLAAFCGDKKELPACRN